VLHTPPRKRLLCEGVIDVHRNIKISAKTKQLTAAWHTALRDLRRAEAEFRRTKSPISAKNLVAHRKKEDEAYKAMQESQDKDHRDSRRN
jgi:uncharacterized membrane protein